MERPGQGGTELERAWWKEAVVYQIYPRSFQDSNGDGIGDLPGILSRLDYLKTLGVDVLWLSPFFKSPNDDNGYDIADYRAIMTEFGTMEDMDALLAGMARRGMKLVMDLVVNHTSDEHDWFQQSKMSRDNDYSDYYIWKNPRPDGSPPNDWTSIFSGPAWEFVPERGQYYLHLFSKKQPDLNWDNPKVRREVHDIMRFWLDKGVAGFRMDVINLISKAFPPSGEDQYFQGPRLHEFLREMNREVLAGRDLLTVGECPGATTGDGVDFSAPEREELSMIFTFEHMDLDSGPQSKWDLREFTMPKLRENLTKWQEALHGRGWNSLYLNNHDQPRMVSRFGDDGTYWVQSAKLLANIVHFLEGTPYIYQGEELGMTNLDLNGVDELRDLESINAWRELVEETGNYSAEQMLRAIRIKGRDNARSPMQWDNSPQAGFTTGTPWLKVNGNYIRINAAQALQDPDSVFHYYQRLLSLRRELPVMVYGEYIPVLPDHPQLFAWERILGDERLLVVNNFSAEPVRADLSGLIGEEEFSLFLANYPDFAMAEDGVYSLRPWEAFVLYNEAREEIR